MLVAQYAMGVVLETPRDLLAVYQVIDIISYIMSSSAIVLNATIFLAFCLQRTRRTKYHLSPAGYLVMNLLAADCLGGIACVYAAQFKLWPENARAMAKYRYICPIRFALGFLGFLGSHFALLCVVIDRYIAVLWTMQYRDWMTTRTTIRMIVVSWIIPVTGATVIMTKNEWHEGVETCNEATIIPWYIPYVWVPLTVLVLVVIVAIQAKVHFELRKRSKSDSPLAIVLRRVTRKSTRVLLQSTTIFIVCWGYFDFSLLAYLCYKENKTVKLVYDISFPVAVSSFLSNPTLYSYQTNSIGKPVKDLAVEIKNLLTCNKEEVSPVSSLVHRDSNQGAAANAKGLDKRLSFSSQTVVTSIDYNVA